MALAPDDPIYALRAELAREIVRALGGSFAQFFVSRRYGIPQPRMSELCRGNVGRCSMEWLIRRIHRMGGVVRLSITVSDPEEARRRKAIEERARQQRAAWEERRQARERSRRRGRDGPGADGRFIDGPLPDEGFIDGPLPDEGFIDGPIPDLE